MKLLKTLLNEFMSEPKRCPKCGESSDGISNAFDMCEMMGIVRDGSIKEWMCGKCSYFFNGDEAELGAWYDGKDFSKMALSQIADVIIDDWRDIPPAAWKYAEAMMNLDNINDKYGQDDAKSITGYFLANAQKWRGPAAREIKKHLRRLLEEN